ncbi:hypothetical protein IEE94_08985 [Yimella sp. cx-573]|nr:hypothetical protein [Yimella sp. cx-573]
MTKSSGYKGYVKMTTQTNAGLCAAPKYTSCSQAYYYFASSDTSGTSSTTYIAQVPTTGVNRAASYARAYFNAKLSVPLRPDPTGGDTYASAGLPY